MKTVILIAVGLLLLIGAAVLTIALRVGWKLITPARKPLDTQPGEYGIEAYEEVSFTSRDDRVQLSGWYMTAEANHVKANGKTIIFAHGYSQNRQEPHLPALALAARLVRAGFDVLMFDFRNAGQSGGRVTSVGYYEQRDVLGAVDFIATRRPGGYIGLVGFSMGASTALLAAADDDRVQAVVADSPFSSLRRYLGENMPRWTGLPHLPFTWVILKIVPLLIRANIHKVNPWQAVERFSPRPILFIHGLADQTIPYTESCRLLERANERTGQLWLVPDADHVRSYRLYPDEYAERVIRFFGR